MQSDTPAAKAEQRRLAMCFCSVLPAEHRRVASLLVAGLSTVRPDSPAVSSWPIRRLVGSISVIAVEAVGRIACLARLW